MNDSENKNMILSFKDNILFLSIISLILLSCEFGNNFTIILLCYVFNYFIYGNVARLYRENESKFKSMFRRSIYIFLMAEPLVFGYGFYTSDSKFDLLWLFIIIVINVGCICTNLKNIRIMLSYDIIGFSRKISRSDYFSLGLVVVLSSIFEELFYRKFIIMETCSYINIFSVVLSMIMFLLHHFNLKWSENNFTKKDYYMQLILGLINGLVYYYTHNILLCIISHLIFNGSQLVLIFRQYKYHYIMNR